MNESSLDKYLWWGVYGSALQKESLRALDGHDNDVTSAIYSPDGNEILTASKDFTAKTWRRASGECLHTLEGRAFLCSKRVWTTGGRTERSPQTKDKKLTLLADP